MEINVDRGILGSVPGDLISAGSNTLPPPGKGQPAELKAEIQAGHLGRVRITYRLSSSQHHKSINWFWQAVFAERVAE